jgi:HEAT repeat protein
VYAALKAARTDRERERLTALRYRLVASDALALGWPSGFDRLAAAAPANRHAALDELAARVTPADSPLLLELFADPDPLVRERSLKLLQTIGGQGTTAGLVRLLRDPEPNVRAAVLKQLAAAPVKGFDAEVAAFAKTEADADLVVHAVRVLREAKTAAAAAGLRELLGHASWRVRAEAAESLGKIIGRYTSGPLTAEQKADVYATMVTLLADPDEFVVSRAVIVLKDAHLPAAIDPMVKAADRRPELAPDVVQALAAMENGAGVNHLRRFCAHPSPAARAAAIAGLVEAAPGDCGPELKAALADAEPTVRAAGLKAVVHAFEKMRPQENFGDDKPAPDPEQWLAAFRGGAGRPGWANDVVPLLDQLAAGTDPSTRPATGPATMLATKPSSVPAGASNTAIAAAATRTMAAVALAAVGKDDLALPVLRAAAAGPAEQQHAAAGALAWLPWDARLSLYRELAARADRDGRSRLLGELVEIRNPAAVPVLWEALAAPDADVNLAASAFDHLRKAQLGAQYYSSDDKAKAKAKPLVETAAKLAESGTEAQRLAALGVLTALGGEQAAKTAAKLYADAALPAATRGDAFHVLLLTSPAAAGRDAALAVLKEPGTTNWELRKTAVKYLARGPNDMGPLRGRMYLSYSAPSRSSFSFFGGSSSSTTTGRRPPRSRRG